ncbi:50S ribosomal protein L2 [Candidatus Bathyarchaeota archaeon]|nr:50S ribosomal protein L2 [Candidatus Bathyarchaeota archaeon]MBS7630748.1 50S ribosomal protein L2 [Candidatus Bathyarchaeota archaeon]
MGKKIRVQRRGRGTPTFRAKKKGKIHPVGYLIEKAETANGSISKIFHETGRSAPLALVELKNGLNYITVAAEGVYRGQEVSIGPLASVKVGNVLPLGDIPEGTIINNIELKPNDGGKLVRSSGSYAIVISHQASKTSIKLPSKRIIELPNDCRATIGVVAGAGRKEKPYLKAGEKFYLMKAKGRVYPRSKGISMIAASHPHGGGRHRHVGKPTTVARNTSPGRKVGLIAARSTGRKKRTRTA